MFNTDDNMKIGHKASIYSTPIQLKSCHQLNKSSIDAYQTNVINASNIAS